MAYPLFSEGNMSDASVLFTYPQLVSEGIFIPLLLAVIYSIITLGIYFSQKRMIGTGDIAVALTIGGFSTLVLAFILRMIPGLVSGYVIAVLLVITLISFLFLLFSHD